MENINANKFAEMLCDKLPLTKQLSTAIVKTFFDTIISEVKNNKAVVFKGFGKFVLKTKKERIGRNPKTGETVKIPAKTFLKFYPAKEFKNII